MYLFNELKRRNVFRVAIGYVVSSWLLLQVADLVLENIAAPSWVIQTIMLVLALGFPVVLFFSWAYEVTPEGIKRESEIDHSQSITQTTGRKLDRAIMAVLVIALAYLAFDKFVLSAGREKAAIESAMEAATSQTLSAQVTDQEASTDSNKSIAVLPFVNMSDDAGNEFFSDGISEELLNLLAKTPELRVTSRTSAFAFKGKDIDIPALAEKLKVAHILEGSVRKSGNQVRITAQLIEVKSDTHIWSETYDRQLNDIFAIQDEIATKVVEQLKITLLGTAPKIQAADPTAYALSLQARHLRRLGTAEGYEQSIELYKQALVIDPDYAVAWGGLTNNYINQAGYGLLPKDEGFTLAREAAENALAIDPGYAPSYASLGWIARAFNNDLALAARHYEKALSLDPANTDIINNAAALLQSLNRLDEAIALTEYVTARDPVSPTGHFNLGLSYLYAGRLDEAIASHQTVLQLSPGRMTTHYWIGVALLFKSEAEAALEAFAQEEDEEYRVKGMALALYALDRQEEYQARLSELIERWGDDWPSEVAHVYAYIGDAENAFQWLDKAIDLNEDGLTEQFLLKYYQALYTDPRWADFLNRVGSSPEQQNAIEYKVTPP